LRFSFCISKQNGRYPDWITASNSLVSLFEALSGMEWDNNPKNDERNAIEQDGLIARHQSHWRDEKRILAMILLHHVQSHR